MMSSNFPTGDSPVPAVEAGQTVIKRLKERGGEEGKTKDDSKVAEGGRGDGDDSSCDLMTTSTKRESIYANATMIAGTVRILHA